MAWSPTRHILINLLSSCLKKVATTAKVAGAAFDAGVSAVNTTAAVATDAGKHRDALSSILGRFADLSPIASSLSVNAGVKAATGAASAATDVASGAAKVATDAASSAVNAAGSAG